jgi:hypothetical protein
MSDFHIVDLIAQREAVRQHTRGWSCAEVVAWLASRGHLYTRNVMGRRDIFFFESGVGLEAVFFFDGDQIVFIGEGIATPGSLPIVGP